MRFYINETTHEIHKQTCEYVNPIKYPQVIYLGIYNYPSEAKLDALRRGYYNADGCAYCCPTCHTK